MGAYPFLCMHDVVGVLFSSEEVGHILFALDYELRLNGNNCVFYVANLASLKKCQREVKLQLGSLKGRSALKTLQVWKASCWSTGVTADRVQPRIVSAPDPIC